MLATWKDLCIDALDPEAQAVFWSAATGLAVNASGRNVSLDGVTPAHRIWVNEVDRPHTVKNRLHLDVDTGSVDELVKIGARVLRPASESGLRWSVLADPEGNEFCAFERAVEDLPDYRLHGIGIDCRDAAATARWWGEVLGAAPVEDPADGVWTITGAAVDDRLTLDFAPVPEPRQGPHRVHWDLVGDADELLAFGATPLWDTERWRVLADPEGNEFCVFPR